MRRAGWRQEALWLLALAVLLPAGWLLDAWDGRES